MLPGRGARLPELADLSEEPEQPERLLDDAEQTHGGEPAHVVADADRRDEDHRYVLRLVLHAQADQRVRTVEPRHQIVEDNQVRTDASREDNGLGPGGAGRDGEIALPAER